MSTGRVFTNMSSEKMATLIKRAQARVLLCIPAIRSNVADAITKAALRIGGDEVRVVLDCDEEVHRLGYGNIEAVKRLREAGIDVRHSPGLRVGLLIVDDYAWVFTPTALFVQREVHSDETPNAVELPAEAAERLAIAVSPPDTSNGPIKDDAATSEPEVGQTSLDENTVNAVAEGLRVAPPIPFDVARQVRVFQPYIQYVEISLRGCAIERHRVTVPRKIQEVEGVKDLQDRLTTTFNVITRDSDVSSKFIQDKLNRLKEDYARSLGKPWGRVLLRRTRPDFDQDIAAIRRRLEEHRKTVKAELAKRLDESRRELVDYYLPIVRANPPRVLKAQTIMVPTDDDIRRWLESELAGVFPQPEELLKAMSLNVLFRDVTYDTLNEDGFAKALEEAFPIVDWDKPFHEFHAAKERVSSETYSGGRS